MRWKKTQSATKSAAKKTVSATATGTAIVTKSTLVGKENAGWGERKFSKPKNFNSLHDGKPVVVKSYKMETRRYSIKIYKPNTPDATLVDAYVIVNEHQYGKEDGRVLRSMSTIYRMRNSSAKRIANVLGIKFMPLADTVEFQVDRADDKKGFRFICGHKTLGQPDTHGTGYIRTDYNEKHAGLESVMDKLNQFPKNKKIRTVKVVKIKPAKIKLRQTAKLDKSK